MAITNRVDLLKKFFYRSDWTGLDSRTWDPWCMYDNWCWIRCWVFYLYENWSTVSAIFSKPLPKSVARRLVKMVCPRFVVSISCSTWKIGKLCGRRLEGVCTKRRTPQWTLKILAIIIIWDWKTDGGWHLTADVRWWPFHQGATQTTVASSWLVEDCYNL